MSPSGGRGSDHDEPATTPDVGRESTRSLAAGDLARLLDRRAERGAVDDVLLRAVVDALPGAVWVLDLDGNVLLWNAAAERLTGWREDAVLGRPLPPLTDETSFDLRALLAPVVAGRPLADVELRHRRDGADAATVLSFSAAPIRDPRGEVVAVVAMATDATAPRDASDQALERARLYESERRARGAAERLQSLTAALSEAATPAAVGDAVMRQGVAALGAYAGVIALATADGAELELLSSVGYPPEACMSVGRRWPTSASMPIAEAARTGASVFVESPRAWGDRYLGGYAPKASASAAWAAIPITAEGRPRGALLWTYDRPHDFGADERALMEAVARQCSQALDRARLYEAEQRARREAEQARERADEANRAKTEFLAVMSHELRTPLNAIAGYAELLDIGVHGSVTDEQRDAIGRIRRNQRHLLGLINDVLNFARIEAGHLELEMSAVPMRETLAALEPLVAPQVRGRSLVYAYEPCDPSVTARADAEKVRQVLLNLLSNAIKFTDEGGRVTVSCAAAGDVVRVTVADTGRGIAADKLERIFEPFVQLDAGHTRRTGGTGLGLAISRDLARAMGGEITAASAEGEGSRFTLTLRRSA